MSNPCQRENFDQLLLDAIDEGLSALGEAGKASIYINLEQHFNIRRRDISCQLDALSNAMKRIFGQGAKRIELLFMEKIYAKVEVVCKRSTCECSLPQWFPEMTFQEYVHLMQQYFESANTGTLRKQTWRKSSQYEKNTVGAAFL